MRADAMEENIKSRVADAVTVAEEAMARLKTQTHVSACANAVIAYSSNGAGRHGRLQSWSWRRKRS